ncbi:MAG TPA: hypothetical protein VKQ52_06360 [Puia sp.]|nr:hypothetical protein [Puia sp.]
MTQEKMENRLKDIPKPEPMPPAAQEMLRLTLLNAKRSSRVGLLLIVLPGLVVLVFFFQNAFNTFPGLTRWFAHEATLIPMPLRAILLFLFLAGFPFIALVINMLAITYYRYNPLRREVTVIVKMKWNNILVAVFGCALATFYILHLLADTLLGK